MARVLLMSGEESPSTYQTPFYLPPQPLRGPELFSTESNPEGQIPDSDPWPSETLGLPPAGFETWKRELPLSLFPFIDLYHD